jgi:hypothetical protein
VLNQAGIAAVVTQPILYTVLLTAGAVVAIGIGKSRVWHAVGVAA